jgi:hypothetical protein
MKIDGDMITEFSLWDVDFKLDPETIYTIIKTEKKNWWDADRDIEIYEMRKSGMLLEDIALEKNLSKATISRTYDKVQGAYNFYAGHLFERLFHACLKKTEKYKNARLLGGSGQPDIVCKDGKRLYVFSLKSLNYDETIKIKIKELMPECLYAYRKLFPDRSGKKYNMENVSLYLIIYNNRNNSLSWQYIDFLKPVNFTIKDEIFFHYVSSDDDDDDDYYDDSV